MTSTGNNPVDFAALAQQHRAAVDETALQSFAKSLGVKVDSLKSLEIGRDRDTWVFPERDADGRIIGVLKRLPDGKKIAIVGSRRGLTMAWPLPAYAGSSPNDPILIVEGPTCTAAGLDLGFVTIGRPSATGGTEHLQPLLRDRHVVISGENDGGAGRLGADKIAQAIVGDAALVRIIYPPSDDKDLRDWAQHADRAEIETAIGEADQVQSVSVSAGKTIIERSDPIPLAEHFTEQGNAERMIARHGELLRFCDLWGKWLIWDSSRWRIDDVRRIEALGVDTIKSIYAEAAAESDQTRRQSIAKWARKSEAGHHLRQMIELARHRVPVVPGDLDADPWLLNVSNGTIDLHTGELREHRRGDLITKVAPVEYDPEATCLTFDRFIDETTSGREDVAAYLQQFLGICVTGDIAEQVLPVWFGSGSNGKNTLIDPIVAIMGDYAGKAAPELLVAKKWTTHPTEIADLFGKRLVVASETEKNQRLRVQFVKEITGDATLKGRFMRQDFFEFNRTHKTILITNNRPDVDEQTHAIWRRIHLVPFTNVVPDEKQDKELSKKLLDEAPGILAWIVRGCLSWQADGLIVPGDVRAATKQYRAECDHIAQFFDECVTLTPGAWTASSRLTDCFDQWCRENAVEPNHRELKQRLRQEHCEPRSTRQGRGWSGVGIVTDRVEIPD